MESCDYFLFVCGFQSSSIPACLGIAACIPVAILLTLTSLASIVLADVDIELLFRADAVVVDAEHLVVTNNATVASHFFARHIQTRDAVGDGSNGLSNGAQYIWIYLKLAR